jgi:hypothetical protein
MLQIKETLKAKIAENATKLAAEEQFLTDINNAIQRGMVVEAQPSKIITRIEYLKGVHIGLMTAVWSVEEAEVNA